MDELIIEDAPVLDLEIAGSVGEFMVKPTTPHATSIPVRYIQTHLKFNLDGSHQQRFFETLLPVREIFSPALLGFDEIMQRDIDDSRVSTSLIPYLLESHGGEVVRFFPPIVAVVVPIDSDGAPCNRYPTVEDHVEPRPDGKSAIRRTRSGPAGNETFEFRLVEQNGRPREFDGARLHLNTSRCRIVIVDGQHRAMALLALYRNVKGWPEKTAAVKDYYTRWLSAPKDNLNHISLPIAVCVFPTLAEGTTAKTTIIEASRAVFLALNKHAKPVSRARNILLDDQDLIAHFERRLLEEVKRLGSSPEYEHPLRLWCFELDADENRLALNSTVAFSGVMHLFTALERVLLLKDSPQGLHYPARRYGNTKNISDTGLRRLDAKNLLGEALAASTSRYAFSPESRDVLVTSFFTRYGHYIVRLFESLWPYRAMASASLSLEAALRLKHHDLQNHASLFEGQGILGVFESYIDQLSVELNEKYPDKNYPASLAEILKQFIETRERLRGHQRDFSAARTQRYLDAISASKIVEPIQKAVHDFFRTVVTTAAFQIALFVTFFSTLERLNGTFRKPLVYGDESDTKVFDEYLTSLNAYLRPSDEADVKRLLNVFSGKVSGTFGSKAMAVSENAFNLKRISIPGELKPDEWPRFRYIILEMWQSADVRLQPILTELRDKCRGDVLKGLYDRLLNEYCDEKGLPRDKVKDVQVKNLQKRAIALYQKALSDLVGEVPSEQMDAIAQVFAKPEPAIEEAVGTENGTA